MKPWEDGQEGTEEDDELAERDGSETCTTISSNTVRGIEKEEEQVEDWEEEVETRLWKTILI